MWEADKPISELPDSVRDEFAAEAKYLLDELGRRRLEVILIPAPEPRHIGHKIRSVENTNPPWYRELFRTHPSVERKNVVKALERISQLKDGTCYQHCYHAWYTYDMTLREIIQKRLVDGYEDGEIIDYVPANKKVRRYFKRKEREAKKKK